MFLLPLLACGPRPEPADLFVEGAIYTMGDAGRVEALAVRAGRIAWAGEARAGRKHIGPETQTLELGTRVVLPGFFDAHTHLAWSAAELLDVDLYDATTLEELLEAIAERAESAPDEPWIRGGGWDVSLFNDVLHRSQLDAIVPDRPVYMGSADAHSAWVNSRALDEAGITADTPDPDNGAIERDENGEPTGILREDAMELVASLMPDYGEAQVDEGLGAALEEAASYGLTGIVDACVEDWMLAGYRRAEDRGALTVRVWGAVETDAAEPLAALAHIQALAAEFDSESVSVNAAKLYLDGVLESQTAWLLEPYVDGTNAEPAWSDAEVATAVTLLEAAGIQVHAHVIGDAAVRQILDALEASEATNGAGDRRALLAHLELIHPDDLARFAGLGALADFQMVWAYADSYITDWTIPYIGDDRAAWLYPIGSVAAQGGTLVAGSDWSVSTMNPWEAIEVAVTRADPWEGGSVLNAEEAISVTAAVRAYTRDGARAVFAEEDLGTLDPGKRADFVVLDRDPFEIDVSALSDVRVEQTWRDGRRIWRAEPGSQRTRRPPLRGRH